MSEKSKFKILPRFSYRIFIYLIFAVLIAVNSFWLFPSLAKIRQDAALLQLETANRARDEVHNFINGHIAEAERMSGNIFLAANKEIFLNFLLKNKDIQQASLIDKTGREIFKVHRYRKIYNEDLQDRSSEAGFIQALLNNEYYIGPVFTENLEPMLNIMIPWQTAEPETEAVLEIILNLKGLWNKIGDLKVGSRGVVYIVSANGIVIAHKDPGVVLSGAYLLDRELIRTVVLDKKVVPGLGPESRFNDLDGQEVFGVGVPIQDLNWGAIAQQPWQDAFAARSQIIYLVVATLGLSLVLLLLLQIVVGRLIKTAYLLEQEKNQSLAIISNLTDGLVEYDSQIRIKTLNPRAEEILGVKANQVLGKIITTDLVKDKRLAPLVKVLYPIFSQTSRKVSNIENNSRVIGVSLDKPRARHLEVVTVPVLSPEGETTAFLKILHDVTREKLAEKIKSDFVSLAAHQLRTPLSAIKWIIQMFIAGDVGELNQEQKEFIGKAYESNERMIALTNDLLNVARIEEGRYLHRPAYANIEEIIRSEIDSLKYKETCRKNNINLIFKKSAKKLPLAWLDAPKIRLALQNLLDNAIKYTLSGGKITVSLKSLAKSIEVEIRDSGVGIPKDQQGKIFTKFFRASNAVKLVTQGTGLGLFLTRNIIEAHGGKIWFSSEQGKGTTFYFTLKTKS